MDCLRSFNFTLANQSNYTVPNGFKYWPVGAQHFWLLELTGSSTYNVQGFKNINIFKIEVTGDIYSAALPVGVSVIPQNWSFNILINGQNSQGVGNVTVTPDNFGMTAPALNPTVILSKFNNSIDFESPIQSPSSLVINKFYADGIANQSLLSGQLGYVFVVTVFYKFEGE
jgi:hypothetical protein